MRFVVAVVFVGCSHPPPTCAEAIERVAAHVPSMASAKERASELNECTENKWSDEMRSCIADARSDADVIECARSFEAKRKK